LTLVSERQCGLTDLVGLEASVCHFLLLAFQLNHWTKLTIPLLPLVVMIPGVLGKFENCDFLFNLSLNEVAAFL